jgi:hypothetical protein
LPVYPAEHIFAGFGVNCSIRQPLFPAAEPFYLIREAIFSKNRAFCSNDEAIFSTREGFWQLMRLFAGKMGLFG